MNLFSGKAKIVESITVRMLAKHKETLRKLGRLPAFHRKGRRYQKCYFCFVQNLPDARQTKPRVGFRHLDKF